MRRKISLLLALCLCVGALSGCMSARERFFGKPSEAVKKPTEQTEPTEPTTEPSTEPSTQENRTDVLTCEDVMSFVEAYVEENYGMTISATDFEVKDGEHAGDLFYSFTYEELFLHVMVTERDGNVIQIVGTVLPFKLAEIISPEDAIPTALAFAAVPVLVCEEDSDLEQIVKCFVDTAAPMEESETTMEGAWSGDGWEYSGMMNGTTVIIGAQRQGVDDNQQTEPVPPTMGATEDAPLAEPTTQVQDAYTYIGTNRECHIPEAYLNGTPAEIINKTIYLDLGDYIRREDTSVSYLWTVNHDILSICVRVEFLFGRFTMHNCAFYVYNVSISGGYFVPDSALLEQSGLTEEQYLAQASQALEAKFREWNADYLGSPKADQWLEQTVSYTNLHETKLFYNTDGELCFVGGVYFMVGPEVDAVWYSQALKLSGGDA